MNSMNADIELLDNYIRGKLSTSDAADLEKRLAYDEDLRLKLAEQKQLMDSFALYKSRKDLRQLLEETHVETREPAKVITMQSGSASWRKFWPMMAVAASIALLCVLGTWLIVQTRESRQKAEYRALRRNLDQIQKSQKMLMEDLAEQKEKNTPVPGRYAGTGFLISGKGYVATSYHVIRDADSLHIENSKFGILSAIVVFSDPANDVSILKIDPEIITQPLPYTLVRSEADLAEGVYTLGYPREDVVFGEGSISALTGFKQNPNAYQVSVPVNPGNSGGPLLNNSGDLVGMISGIQTETVGAAFAIKSTVLLDVILAPALDSLKIPVMLPKQNSIRNSGRVQQVKRWKDFVFMVRVYKN